VLTPGIGKFLFKQAETTSEYAVTMTIPLKQVNGVKRDYPHSVGRGKDAQGRYPYKYRNLTGWEQGKPIADWQVHGHVRSGSGWHDSGTTVKKSGFERSDMQLGSNLVEIEHQSEIANRSDIALKFRVGKSGYMVKYRNYTALYYMQNGMSRWDIRENGSVVPFATGTLNHEDDQECDRLILEQLELLGR
jgi:hypothetical protein